jgi:HAD superfamily hydrolase (TIGR01509 family)
VSAPMRTRQSVAIAALVLDMDGLLVDSETLAGEALRLFLRGHGHEMLPSTLERALGRRLPEAIAVVAEEYGLPGPLDELVVAYDAIRLEALRGHVVPMPGAVALLDWAAAKGLPRALATSSARGQAEVALTEAGLMGRFDVEVTGDEVQFGKPAPDLFLLAAERLGVPPESCVVFEDAPAGLEAAARAGMRRVWVPNAHTRHLAPSVAVDARLESLVEAIGWLEAKSSGGQVLRNDSPDTNGRERHIPSASDGSEPIVEDSEYRTEGDVAGN